MKKRILSLVLALCLCFGMTAYAFEVDGIDYPEAGSLNFETQIDDGYVFISWDAPREIEVPITDHYIYCRNHAADEETIYVPNPGETFYEFSGLENGTEYDIGVVYVYETEFEIDAGAYVTPNKPLTAPVVKGAVIENGKLTISWDQPADRDRIVSYILEFYGENDSFMLDLYAYIMDELEYTLDTTTELQKELYTVYLYAMDYNDVMSDIAVIEVDNRASAPEKPKAWPFTDVNDKHENYEAIKFVYSAGLMLGTGDGSTFAPEMSLSRAMVARILHTIVDNPTAAPSNFTDVARNFWYTEAIDWASTYKIISGYGDGRFGPNDNVTREQLAVMLYHFARSAGFDVASVEKADLMSYYDGQTVSGWAMSAVQWACSVGALTDDGMGNLFPTTAATRAEVAEALLAFVKYYS